MESSRLFSLEGKRALVTGGNRGLGLAMARGLARQGARVVVAARDLAALEAAQAAISGEGLWCRSLALDVSSQESVNQGVAQGEELAGGAFGILVNNAGIAPKNLKAEDMDPAELARVLDINAGGYFRVAQAVVKGMIAAGGGKIVNVSSILGASAVPLAAAYCASKGAVNQLTRAWAVEWARYNIQVNAVAPGFIITDINKDQLGDERFQKKVVSRIPMGRLGRSEDLVGPVVMLCSDAGSYITGQIINIDGGQSAA